MRSFQTNKSQNNYVKSDQNLIQHGHDGDLSLRERALIAYLCVHKNGYRVGTKQIAEETKLKVRTVQRILSSLEKKGYLYKNKENWHPKTGPEFIVAETPDLLQDVLEAENLFEPSPEPESTPEPNSTEPNGTEPNGTQPNGTQPNGTEPNGTQPNGTGLTGANANGTGSTGTNGDSTGPSGTDGQQQTLGRPAVSEEPLDEELLDENLFDGYKLGGHDWAEVPHPPRPVFFARPPLREMNNAREKMPDDWRLWVAYNAGEALGTSHVSYLYAPSVSGIPVRHMCRTGTSHVSYLPDSVRHECRTHKTITKVLLQYLGTITNAPLLPNRRLSGVRRQRVRAPARLNPGTFASNRQTTPDLDRSHNRLWVNLFGDRDAPLYHGIRAYVEDERFSEYKPTLKDDLSIYWLNPDAEWEEGALPTKPEETPNITERPLDEDADPRAQFGVEERYASVGVLSGKDDPHPHDKSFRWKVAIEALGAKLFDSGISFSLKEGPGPWPKPDPRPDPDLNFAGHRPDEQLPEMKSASSLVNNTQFLKNAMRAVREAIEQANEDPNDIPQEPIEADYERAEEHGKDPRAMMLLRQIATVEMSPHIFHHDRRYDSPGKDPWPTRMYEQLAFPDEVTLTVEAKRFIDDQIMEEEKKSPAEWARVLLMGMEEGWNPSWVKNFTDCYRHELRIELDPERDMPPGGPRTSKGEIRRGNGIDMSKGDPKEIVPPKEGYA